eukprot:6852662-Pyramimonas_sp.AAC.1
MEGLSRRLGGTMETWKLKKNDNSGEHAMSSHVGDGCATARAFVSDLPAFVPGPKGVAPSANSWGKHRKRW